MSTQAARRPRCRVLPPRRRASARGRLQRRDSPAFRPDIEGLRAVAVALVVLFHASIPGFAGGYVGVDVFFVLSGFLITGLLVRELETTGTDFIAGVLRPPCPAPPPGGRSWSSSSPCRLRRAAAAADRPGVAADVAAAAAYVSNMRFAIQATDYFAGGQAPSPLLHYWSLGGGGAVLPLLAGDPAARRRRRGRQRSRVTAAVVLVTGGSFMLSLWMTSASAPWAFFSLPTRAWELGLGATARRCRHRGCGSGPTLAGVARAGSGLATDRRRAASLSTTRCPSRDWRPLLPTLGAGARPHRRRRRRVGRAGSASR